MNMQAQRQELPKPSIYRQYLDELALLPHLQLFIVFALLAVVARLIFMFYTGRIWEDALIALTSARNMWEGHGLTHHASEPRVQSFSSVIGEMIMVIGEAVRQGLLAIQLASLAASVAAVYFAYRIGILLSFNWAAHTLVLSYLAIDHLQVFFGMAGMETQVVTTILLANAYFYLTSKWLKLGFATGLAILSRPEFILWAIIIFTVVIIWHREARAKVLTPAIVITLIWSIFAVSYFGTITPHTVIAKSIVYERTPFAPLPEVLQFCLNWWKHIAPFKQYWAASGAPVPDAALKMIVLLLVTFGLVGVYHASQINRRVIPIVILVAGFIFYRTVTANGPYSMWYLPPFMALFFLFAGAGVTFTSILATYYKAIVSVVSCVLALTYAAPLAFALPLDKRMQESIEIGVRTRVGDNLNDLMKAGDCVVLEPLGYVGWSIRNKTVYDYPGLASPIALKALMKKPGTGLGGMMETLSPTFVVLRPDVLRDINLYIPDTAALYKTVRHVTLEKQVELGHWGYSYNLIDDEFFILTRKDLANTCSTEKSELS